MKTYKTQKGTPNPIGAKIINNGVNFCIYSPFATKIDLLLFNHEDDINPTVINLSKDENKSYYYWHIFIEGLTRNQLYAYRIDGPFDDKQGLRFDYSKVLIDPYAKMIVGKADRKMASIFGIDNISSCYKSAVISDEFDWEDVKAPEISPENSIIYEMHVKGFTKDSSSGIDENLRGTFKGIIQKLDYLKELGINTIELLPIFSFDSQDAPGNLSNYWGYSPLGFFSLHQEYSSGKTPQEKVDDFKTFVKTLHKNGFILILDVVYNHTTENDYKGPTYSFRGIGNNSYYILDENGNYKDFTGCGNTLNTNHSVLRRIIRQSLYYWVRDFHVDGFRFDLASVLSRDEDGIPLKNPPILWSIDSSPILTKTMLIAEAWDASGLYQTDDFAGDKWLVWNGKFRDVMRKFIKGDEGLSHLAMIKFTSLNQKFKGRYLNYSPKRTINFITAHDGFTLNDLCTFQDKKNHENLEFNRDGSNENFNWNCGFEGETPDELIDNLRLKMIKNYFVTLILSHGIPMIIMGDEIRRTQKGNNNAYCQDNQISWMDWNLVTKNKELFNWVKSLISIRKDFSIFSYDDFFSNTPNHKKPYIIFHGLKRNYPTWNYYDRHFVIELVHPKENQNILFIFNMYWENQIFELPLGNWRILLYSDKNYIDTKDLQLEISGRSICILEKK